MTLDARAELRRALLSPRSVAIVGQSDDTGKTTGRPLKFLRQAGYRGAIYPINPRHQTVLGERAWKSVAALPEAPDHAYLVVPTEAGVYPIRIGAPAVYDCDAALREPLSETQLGVLVVTP